VGVASQAASTRRRFGRAGVELDMSLDDTAINSAATWAAFQEGRASWGDWVESRLAEKLTAERQFATAVFTEVIADLANDLRDEFNKALAGLRPEGAARRRVRRRSECGDRDPNF
jgi:hypothetical protein